MNVDVLTTVGWSVERVDQLKRFMHDRSLQWGYRHDPILVEVFGCGRTYIIHRELTSFEAILGLDCIRDGGIVEAWTDGSGVKTDVAVGCAAMLVQDGYEKFNQLFRERCRKYAKDDVVAFPEGLHGLQSSAYGCAAVAHRMGPGTNNSAELTGIHLALANCPRTDLQLVVKSDSEYALGSVNASLGWVPKKNQELIREIRRHLELRPAKLLHVRGHAGDPMNELADRWAGFARRKV